MVTPHSSRQPDGEQQLFSQQSFPQIYEQALVGPLFRPWVDSLLEGVVLGPGDRIIVDGSSLGALEWRVARLMPATVYSRALARAAA